MSGLDDFADDMDKWMRDTVHEQAAQALAEQARDAGVSVDEVELTLETDSDRVKLDEERVRRRAKEILASD